MDLHKLNADYEAKLIAITEETERIGEQMKLLTRKVEGHKTFIRDLQQKLIERLNMSNTILKKAVEKSKKNGISEDRDQVIKLGLIIKDLTVEFDEFVLKEYSEVFKNAIEIEKNALAERAAHLQKEQEALTKQLKENGKIAKDKIDILKKTLGKDQ